MTASKGEIRCMFDGFIAYLLLPPASTVHQCRTPGLSHLSPTSARSPLRTASLCFAPGSLHHRAKPHGAPTPHSSRHPTSNRINDWTTILKVFRLRLYFIIDSIDLNLHHPQLTVHLPPVLSVAHRSLLFLCDWKTVSVSWDE